MKPLAAAAGAVAATLLLAAPAAAALDFHRCGGYGYSCARMSVPLDRSGAVPGRVSLYVKRVPAAQKPSRGAVFALAGGPGQSATAAFEGDALGLLYGAYRDRDLYVFDQRGTGRSGLLRCRSLEHANLLMAGRAAGHCARELGSRRAFYTTPDSVADIEALRVALGIPKVVLFGTSYGTRVALDYAARYPGNVERLILDSLVEPDGPDPLYLDALAAVPRVLRALCRSGCARFSSDPVADVRRLVARIARRPLRGVLVDAEGRRRRAQLDRGELLLILIAGDFDPSLRAAFPGAVRAALDGDLAPLLRLKRRALALDGEPPPPRLTSVALFATTTCEETAMPWDRAAPADPAERRRQAAAAAALLPTAAFDPFDRATALENDLLVLCERWPAVSALQPPPGPLPAVPALLLAGEDDLRTPVENARRVAAALPGARLLVVPATGHSTLGADRSGCARRAFARFLGGRSVPERCPRRSRRFRPAPPPPRALGDVSPAPGVPGRRGRTLAAVALTLRDVGEDAITSLILDPRSPDLARGGGLRAGAYRIDGRNTLRLRRVTFVPGVHVSGVVRRFGERRQRGRLHVFGPATPEGTLRLRDRRVRGLLGGRPVRAGLRPAPAASASSLPRALAGR